MQSYILTYYRLGKREPLVALGSHQGEDGEHFKEIMEEADVSDRTIHSRSRATMTVATRKRLD